MLMSYSPVRQTKTIQHQNSSAGSNSLAVWTPNTTSALSLKTLANVLIENNKETKIQITENIIENCPKKIDLPREDG